MKEKNKIIRSIRRHRRFLIASHVNPEGDSLGSALALRRLLLALGKRAEVVLDGSIPEAYRFLPDAACIRKTPSVSYDVAFVIDCPVLDRIGRIQRFLDKQKPLCVIDHHVSSDRFGTVNWIDPKCAAVGEMVHALYKALKVKIALPEAINLYVSLVTDTGSFRYSNTTAKVHALASQLIRKGIRPVEVSSQLFESCTVTSRRLLGLALQTLCVGNGGKLAWLWVTRKMVSRCSSSPEETEGFVDVARSIRGVRAAVFFKEEKEGVIKVSFRAKGSFDVNRIARRFGGGGHRAASGCLLPGTLEKVRTAVLKEVRRTLGANG
ncbi:MAG: bifunctional oligoribonuclease/PAP phosphatase NrnA [Candidatus Omnitrophota bacterium]